MATFRLDEPTSLDRLDFQLLRASPVTLYSKLPILQADVAWLSSEGYRVLSLRAGVSASAEALLTALARLLSFSESFGSNFEAFNEGLDNVEVPEPGLVLVLEDFGTFAAAFRRQAQVLLDICARQSRRMMLGGRRFLVLAHSKDPKISFEPVGASPVTWNRQECLNSARVLQ
jgi:hypothetical protein